MLLDEYKTFNDLYKLGHWKDLCIKMGSILEFLLTKWLEHKGISKITHSKINSQKKLKDATFSDKILYYLETAGKNHSFEIGKDTEWKIADNIIRDYRNYIHLQKYEKRIANYGPLNERSFKMLERVFKEIINYF